MDNCIFCKIIKNEIPSYTIYEDDIVKVFLDINQDKVGHMLIVPKEHYVNIDDIDINVLTHILETSKKMHTLLKDKLNIDGMCMAQNNGIIQEVKHYHMHIKPFYNNEPSLTIEDTYKKLTD